MQKKKLISLLHRSCRQTEGTRGES